MTSIEVKSHSREEMIDITDEAARYVREHSTKEGVCVVFTAVSYRNTNRILGISSTIPTHT